MCDMIVDQFHEQGPQAYVECKYSKKQSAYRRRDNRREPAQGINQCRIVDLSIHLSMSKVVVSVEHH